MIARLTRLIACLAYLVNVIKSQVILSQQERLFEEQWATDYSNIEVFRDGKLLTRERFEREFYGRKPVLFRNSNDNNETYRIFENRQDLVKTYGNVNVGVASMAHGQALTGSYEYHTSFSNMMQAIGTWPPQDMYFFDSSDGEFLAACKEKLGFTPLDSYKPAPQFDNTKQWENSHLRMTFGGATSGLALHMHHAAYNELFSGAKRWTIFAPGHGPVSQGYNQYESHFLWLKQHANSIKYKPGVSEFVQYPGDVVYIPDGWLHATMNLRLSVSVARNALMGLPNTPSYLESKAYDILQSAAVFGKKLSRKTIAKVREAENYIRMAIKLDPTNSMYFFHLARALSLQSKFDEEVDVSRKGLELNPRSIAWRYSLVLNLIEVHDRKHSSRLKKKKQKQKRKENGCANEDCLSEAYGLIVSTAEIGLGKTKIKKHEFTFLQLLEIVALRLAEEGLGRHDMYGRDALGITPEHVTRKLADLRQRGLL
jgi:ribosomal protein L16 Arg81 hydroxylase